MHLGSGKRHIPGWVHVDLADYPHIDYNHDIRTLPMFADESVSVVYSSHTFEYFDRVEAASVLTEWRRIIIEGGTLRLAVPDIEALIAVYREYRSLDMIIGPLYGRMPVDSNHPDHVLYHRTVYDFASISKILEENGFEDVRRFDWRQTEHAACDDFSQAYIPHMDKENGLLISLNVEATKR